MCVVVVWGCLAYQRIPNFPLVYSSHMCYPSVDAIGGPLYKTSLRDRQQSRLYTRQLKADVIAGYGGRCECCGETQIEFLCIDHADGGGEAWRRKQSSYGPARKNKRGLGSPNALYRHLRKNWYPDKVEGMRLRVLCHNCNQSLGSYGYCPHSEPERTLAEFPLRHPHPKQERMEW